MNKIFKKILILPLIAFSCLLPAISVSCGQQQKTYKWDGTNWEGVRAGRFLDTDFVLDEKEQTITYVNAMNIAASNLVIPNYVTYKEKIFSVRLGESCFYQNQSIVGSVELNDFIQDIPDFCFFQCYSLQDIIFHKMPKKIGNYAFFETILQHIYYLDNNQKREDGALLYVEYIGSQAFGSTWLQQKIILGPNLSYLGLGAFDNCIDLVEVNMESCTQINKIPKKCFHHCQQLSKITLPVSITEFDDYAFYQCYFLNKIYLPNEGMHIVFDDYSLAECNQLVGFSQPFFIDQMGLYVFYNDTNLVIDLFNDSYFCDEIGAGAFSNCTQINGIVFNDGIKNVGYRAFSGCSNLCILDFSQCSPDYLDNANWDGEFIFDMCSPNGIIYVNAGAVFSLEWIDFFEEKGIHIKGEGDENGWMIIRDEHIKQNVLSDIIEEQI